MTAEEVTRIALRDLEAGRLISLPQVEAGLTNKAKRFIPGLYLWSLKNQVRSGAMFRFLEKAREKAMAKKG